MKRSDAIEEVRRICRFKHYALATEDNYAHWVGRFFDWLKVHHAEVAETPEARMEGFLSMLAVKHNVAASTQNGAFAALLFFYRHVMKQEPGNVDALRAKRPRFLRHAPPREEVLKILSAVRDSPAYPFRLILFMMYGCGLRVSEPVSIRIRDLDFGQKRVIIRQAKGAKDRMVPIPEMLIGPLQQQVQAARAVWRRACAQGVPVQLPHLLGRKYKKAGAEFGWWWLFPMEKGCNDPRSGEWVWWHCLESGVQRALKEACGRAKAVAAITPHHLRHAWATHAIDAGSHIRDVQAILGHKSLETTMVYVHPEPERVKSPLEVMGNLRLMGGAA